MFWLGLIVGGVVAVVLGYLFLVLVFLRRDSW